MIELQAQIANLTLPTGLPEIDLVGRISAENLSLPQLPPLRIPVIYDIPDLPEGSVEVGEITPVAPPGEIPAPASAAEPIAGVINASLNRDFTEPVQIAGVVNADLPSLTEMIELQGQIANLALPATLPEIDLVARISAENLSLPQLPPLRVPVIYDVP